MVRKIYERHTDQLFSVALQNPSFSFHFLKLILPTSKAGIRHVNLQSRHAVHSGTIDLDLQLEDGTRILIENKIDAGYSVTQDGLPQPDRYAATIAALRQQGADAHSVLLAPQTYLTASRFSKLFDHAVSYEALREHLAGKELALLEAAILQANAPYEPQPNDATADFFAAYEDHAERNWPSLVIKPNPNGKGVRPTGSNTIYFVVSRMLNNWPNTPTPRMSLQCRDNKAPSASVKIMIGGLGKIANHIPAPSGLIKIGGYLRPAGRSLGCVIDTPRLDTQSSFASQKSKIDFGLDAADKLRSWWNTAESDIASIMEASHG